MGCPIVQSVSEEERFNNTNALLVEQYNLLSGARSTRPGGPCQPPGVNIIKLFPSPLMPP